jgi:CBS domain containing-hemolysin-like protein
MVDEAAEAEVLEEDDRELIHSIFEWGETVVREVMIPRTDMITVDDDQDVSAAMNLFLSSGVSRMPVVGKDADEVVGILYLRDVARLSYEKPLAAALVAIGNRVTPGRPRTQTFSSEEQLLSMVDEAAELDVLEQDDRELIHSIFEWGDTVVREVMIPRTDMITIDDDQHLGDAMKQFLATGVSRMPVVGKDADEVLGILYLRDVARLVYENAMDAVVRDVARPALFVPESKKADDTLRQMQLDSNHLAMVVDEYGGIAGLVTMEDLIEELVGDISDEYDRETPDVTDLGDGVFRVSARLPKDELGDLFGIELDDDDVDSAGGLLIKAVGRLPDAGSRAVVSGLILRAERVEGRRKLLRTLIVERDQALMDAQEAFDGD